MKVGGVAIVAIAWFWTGLAEAQTSSLKEVLKNKIFSADQRITDMELKAQAGSLSRYSMKFDLSYSGPPVDNLSDPEVPNPDNRPRVNRTSLGGTVGLRYRLSEDSALNASTGVKWYTPYHHVSRQQVDKPSNEKDSELSNPSSSYDRTHKWMGMQGRTSIDGSVTTQDYYLDRAQAGSMGLSESVKYHFSGSRFVLSMLTDLDFYVYNREFQRSDGRVSKYHLSLIPGLELRVRDQLHLMTSVAYSFANLREDHSWWRWDDQRPTQRLGLGWGISRKVYFNPYLNFFADKPAINTTSLSFRTVFSLF